MSFQAYIDNIEAKTGKTPDDFRKLAEEKGLLKPGVKAGEIVAWLKKDFDLGRGHAMAIYAAITSAKVSRATKEEAIGNHFSGTRAHWRSAFDNLVNNIKDSKGDVQIATANTYLSLLKDKKKFAIVQVTGGRMDIGIKLKTAKPTERFEPAGSWNAMVTHRVRINDVNEIDKEVVEWLGKAYDAA